MDVSWGDTSATQDDFVKQIVSSYRAKHYPNLPENLSRPVSLEFEEDDDEEDDLYVWNEVPPQPQPSSSTSAASAQNSDDQWSQPSTSTMAAQNFQQQVQPTTSTGTAQNSEQNAQPSTSSSSGSAQNSQQSSQPPTPTSTDSGINSPQPAAPPNSAAMSPVDECQHHQTELHFISCLKCGRLCNCHFSNFQKKRKYPDIIIRSCDKKLVRVSGELVRASPTLTTLVLKVLEEERKQEQGLPEEKVILKTEFNNARSIVLHQVKPGGTDAGEGEQEEDDFLFDNEERLLAIFDHDSDRPTVGIFKDALLKVDQFMAFHLDDVDERVAKLQRVKWVKEYFPFASRGMLEYDHNDERSTNTYQYADWEEAFFNSISCGKFYDLIKANQELLIWDLYICIQKWTLLNRGFPYLMVNGWYDLLDDPEYDKDDKFEPYGLMNMPYRNMMGRSRRRIDPVYSARFGNVCAKARWWLVKKSETSHVFN